MSFGWPIALLRPRRSSRWPCSRTSLVQRRRQQLRRPVHEPRPARERRRRLAALAASRPGGARAARPDRARRRHGAAAGRRGRAARGGDGDPRDGPLRLDDRDRRRARPDDGGARGGELVRQGPAERLQASASSRSRTRPTSSCRRPPTATRRCAALERSSRPTTAPPSATRSPARSTSASRASTSEARRREGAATRRSSCSCSPTARTRPATTTPLEAAQKADDAKVPVYTVALGTEQGTIAGPGRLRRHADDPRPARSRDAAARWPR